MNRKERRAAQKRGQSAGAGAGDEQLQRLLLQAVHEHQAGRFADAERGYRSVLALNPHSPRALYNLGILALQTKRSALAADLLTQAVALYDRDPEWHYNLGYALQQAGRAAESVEPYRRAIALQPRYLEAEVNLGNVLHELGRLDEAVEQYRRAIALKPDLPDLHYNLGNALKQLGRGGEAIGSLERALALKPHADIHNNLGIALMQDPARIEDALAHYRQALALDPSHLRAKNNVALVTLMRGDPAAAVTQLTQLVQQHPDDPDVHENLAQALLGRGDATAAVAAAVHALERRDSPRARSLFVSAIKQVRASSEQPLLARLMVRALTEGWGRATELADAAASMVKVTSTFSESLAAVAGEPLLIALLTATRISDLDLERFLAAARSALLAEAADPAHAPEAEPMLRFRAALAQQCFINEYVFAATGDDVRATEALRDSISAALAAGAPVGDAALLALASMTPLGTLPQADRLLQRPCSEAVAPVLRQQITEPKQEQGLRAEITRLTPIEDTVSQAVQAQYEENPYPRWVRPPQAPPPLTLEQRLQAIVPLAPLRPLNKGPQLDVLIAGCGTGQHPIEIAQQYPQARILAIDLSAASLAYAMRKTREAGIGNIDYAQADILALGGIGRSFDLIESSGVLHHLGDPFAGGRVLVSLLRPGGLMFLGLYSALARQNIVAARAFITERGYRPTADDIRRCRQDLVAITGDPALDAVKRSSDFFTVSDCRDLLFHVQEHRLTLPQIKRFLAESGLDFLGFDLPPDVRQAYAAQYPDDRSRTDLDRWNEFETQNPATFAGMYQFWAQRAP